MPNEIKTLLWTAFGDSVRLIVLALVAVACAYLHRLTRRLDVQEANQQKRDKRSDEIQTNVRRIINGSGVHHELQETVEPQFNGEPPLVVAHEDRNSPDTSPGVTLVHTDVAAQDQKYID